jgi:hypothetical protein
LVFKMNIYFAFFKHSSKFFDTFFQLNKIVAASIACLTY